MTPYGVILLHYRGLWISSNKLAINNRYRNDGVNDYPTGIMVLWFNKSQSFTLYHKPAEIIDTSHAKPVGDYHKQLATKLEELGLNIIRPEHRIKTSQAIKRELKPILGDTPITFRNIFHSGLAMRVLFKHFYKLMGNGSIQTLALSKLDIKTLSTRLNEAADDKQRRLVPIWVTYINYLKEHDEEQAKQMLRSSYSKATTWKYLKQLSETVQRMNIQDPLLMDYERIESAMLVYEPIQIELEQQHKGIFS